MRLLVLCTCHEVVSNLPQGCVPQNYAILLFAYLLSLPYLVALHCTLNLNSGIVTLIIQKQKCLLLFTANTNILILLYRELKTEGKSFIFAGVCRLP